MRNYALMYGENNTRGYNVNFSGKLPNESVTAAKTLMEKIMDSRAFNWLTGFAGEHNVAAASLIALFLAGGLRPAITISLPGKKDLEDKIYAAGHSMASGVIGFGFSTLITTPIDSGIKFIYKDAKKMRKEDYDKLTVKELADYIRKNNLTPEKIADKMESDKLSKEDILKQLKDNSGNPISHEKMAQFIKDNKGQIIPLKKFVIKEIKDKNGNVIETKVLYPGYLKIVADKVDKVNELKHLLATTTDIMEKENLMKQIKNLENHMKGIDTTMHNISEWAIAIPRAMLTIALIPPILKYVFHVEKGKSANKKAENNTTTQTVVDANKAILSNSMKAFKEFTGGDK
ncbi:hypothetical protein IKP85_06385 [bacterium]|nr:hypothetical protein [bacterium]